MKKIILIVNSKSRQGARLLENIQKTLKDNHHTILNSSPGEMRPDIIKKYASQADAVVVAGGDGSMNSALPQLMETGLPLLVIPAGTANNLATTLQIPRTVKDAVELLDKGQITTIDIGLANNIPFLNLAGIGFSTRVNHGVSARLKRWLGPFAFAVTAIIEVQSMVPFFVRIIVDGREHRAWSWQVTVCNGRHYGAHMVINEKASLVDEKLHALSVEVDKWWHTFALMRSFLKGQFKNTRGLWPFEGKTIQVHTRRHKRVDIDGDIKTKTPLEVKVLPKALKIYIPIQQSSTT